MKHKRNRQSDRLWKWAAVGIGVAGMGLSGCRSVENSPDLLRAALTGRMPASTTEKTTEPNSTDPVDLLLAGYQARTGKDPASDADRPAPAIANDQKAAAPVSNPGDLQAEGTVVLDLAEALRRAGVDNPTIGLAQERIREALAAQLAARSLLLPSLNAGTNFRMHRGEMQDDPGFLIHPNSQGMFIGAGAAAVGTGTVTIPGVWLFSYLSDAIYEPIAAGQVVNANRADAQAVQNSILLNVTTRYLQLVGAEARLGILRRAEAEVNEIVRITTAFARSGEGAAADANRAIANLERVRRQNHQAEGDLQAASAQLTGLLSQDPVDRIRTPGNTVEAFRLVEENADLESLIVVAIRARPELAARAAEIQEAQTRVRQARARPWLPLVAVGYSAGAFGGGSNRVSTKFSELQDRSDLSVLAAWNLQNMGVGNRAEVFRTRAIEGQATANYQAVVNLVREEVGNAQAAARAAASQAQVAKTALGAAEEGFRLDTDRIKLGQGRPIEALDSFRLLLDARLELLRSIIAFDIAQFQLWVALGSTPQPAPAPKANDLPETSISNRNPIR